jgi:HD-GYP domain-containing protein (c-di-GMP phosphodiesterase class II)
MKTAGGLGRLGRWVPAQPATAIVTGSAAALCLAWAWTASPAMALNWALVQSALVVGFLVAVLVWAATHSLHLRHKIKIHLTTLPLYLLAVLAPPAIAATASGLGVLAGQVRMRPQTGNYPSDIATAVSRWVIGVLAASLVAHAPGLESWPAIVPLAAAAVVMFALDSLTAPLELAPMLGEPALKIMAPNVRESGLYEAAQYLSAILAAAAARYEIWSLVLLVIPTYLIYSAFRNAREVHDGTFKLLESLADAVDLRDRYTGGHSRRVAQWAGQVLREINVRGPEAELIVSAARVHDLGKIGVPDHILNKTGLLTPEEKAQMDSHSARGAELLARFPDFARGQAIVRGHHERWDGGGYPDGLHDWDIPFGARVIAVADSFDAMTSDRPYRAAMSVQQASLILQAGSGSQWDPALVEAFLHYLDRAPGGDLPAQAPSRVALAKS